MCDKELEKKLEEIITKAVKEIAEEEGIEPDAIHTFLDGLEVTGAIKRTMKLLENIGRLEDQLVCLLIHSRMIDYDIFVDDGSNDITVVFKVDDDSIRKFFIHNLKSALARKKEVKKGKKKKR